MVNSPVWVSTRFATCYGLEKPPFAARDAIEYGHAACLPSSIRYNERLRTTLSQKTSFIKPSTAQGVNRLYFLVLGQPLRSSCSPTTATLAWFMLRLTSSGIGVPVARTHAPQAKFRQVPAPITSGPLVQPLLSGSCTCSVTVDIQKHFDHGARPTSRTFS
jgi:hypothetical protein